MLRSFKILSVVVIAGFFAACTAEVEESGSLPDVDVEGGEMPNVDIDPVDVDITTDTQVVEVPDIDIQEQE
jgi:hypothetical protein